jgi:hypothetical protein
VAELIDATYLPWVEQINYVFAPKTALQQRFRWSCASRNSALPVATAREAGFDVLADGRAGAESRKHLRTTRDS